MNSLRDRLLEERDVSCKFDLLEAALLARGGHRLEMDRSVDAVLDAVSREPLLPLREIEDQIGLSKKQILARFDSRVGCTPKLTSRILRFQNTVRSIHQRQTHDWAELAQEFGYYDQPHLIHEFQEFAGMTPADYARRRTEYPDYIYLD